MSGKAGRNTVETNNEQKHALGKSANACANKFLAGLRGRAVRVYCGAVILAEGLLIEFDLYSLLIDSADGDRLVFKGPGVVVEAV